MIYAHYCTKCGQKWGHYDCSPINEEEDCPKCNPIGTPLNRNIRSYGHKWKYEDEFLEFVKEVRSKHGSVRGEK